LKFEGVPNGRVDKIFPFQLLAPAGAKTLIHELTAPGLVGSGA